VPAHWWCSWANKAWLAKVKRGVAGLRRSAAVVDMFAVPAIAGLTVDRRFVEP
jgi:hypothetical protein